MVDPIDLIIAAASLVLEFIISRLTFGVLAVVLSSIGKILSAFGMAWYVWSVYVMLKKKTDKKDIALAIVHFVYCTAALICGVSEMVQGVQKLIKGAVEKAVQGCPPEPQRPPVTVWSFPRERLCLYASAAILALLVLEWWLTRRYCAEPAPPLVAPPEGNIPYQPENLQQSPPPLPLPLPAVNEPMEVEMRGTKPFRSEEGEMTETEPFLSAAHKDSAAHKAKKKDKVEPQVDPERDHGMVLSHQMSLKASERGKHDYSRAGKAGDGQLIKDRNTRLSEGVRSIEFMSAPKAIAPLFGDPRFGQTFLGVRPSRSAITDQAGMLEAGVNLADLDDDEGNGLSLNAQSQALLMNRTGTASSFTGASSASVFGQTSGQVLPGLSAAGFAMPALAAPAIDPIGIPSECLLLKNMFDPSLETEPDFDLDKKKDLQDECSKFGRLKHIHIEKNSAGFVYLRFENAQAAMNAQNALHGRWFAGKMITATFMVHSDYEAKFPDSAS